MPYRRLVTRRGSTPRLARRSGVPAPCRPSPIPRARSRWRRRSRSHPALGAPRPRSSKACAHPNTTKRASRSALRRAVV